jgi:hypothetical protein
MQEVLQVRINALADKLTAQYRHGSGEWAQRIQFIAETPAKGQKYIRIVMDEGNGRGGSVHAFVALETGGLHKSAGWKSPARGRDGKVYAPKFNLLDDASFELAMYNCDPYGGYLYADYKIKTPVVDNGVSFLDSARMMAESI